MILVGCGTSGGEAESQLSENQSEKNNSEDETLLETETDTETEAETTPSIPLTDNQNPLTGIYNLSDEAVGKRPVAIMINNLPKALPQYGIAQADIIFEVTVEGGLSRLMAIYGDYTQIPKVCSVRSCRKYFPELSEGFDAIYVCSGMGNDVRAYINTLDLTMYQGVYNTGKLFGRDTERREQGYAIEHTMYFDGTGLVASIEKRNVRIALEEDKLGNAFLFADGDTQVIPDGDACNSVTVDFGSTEATLRYDSKTNTYLKEINGKAQMDSVAGTQLAFTNVIIMETKVGADANGKDRTIDWTGGKNSVAYYISNGHVQKIHWSKDGIESRIVFYDENGEELMLNCGKTYIAINFLGKTTFE